MAWNRLSRCDGHRVGPDQRVAVRVSMAWNRLSRCDKQPRQSQKLLRKSFNGVEPPESMRLYLIYLMSKGIPFQWRGTA